MIIVAQSILKHDGRELLKLYCRFFVFGFYKALQVSLLLYAWYTSVKKLVSLEEISDKERTYTVVLSKRRVYLSFDLIH